MPRDVPFDLSASRAYLASRQAQRDQAREERRRAALADVRAAVQCVLPRFPAIRRAYLFGSVLRPGAMRVTSDVDIALEGELDAETYFAVWRELERAASGWQIEVIELGPDLHFAAFVRERGEIIYERTDPDPEGRDHG